MNLKMRLLVVPSLLAAGVLGACGTEGANEGAGVTTPMAPEVEVVQGEETPIMGEDQVGVTEGDTGEIGVGEDQAGAVTTPDVAVEEQAGVATPETTTEEQAGIETTPDVAAEEQAGVATSETTTEEQAGVETTPDAAVEEQAGAGTTPGMGQFDMMSAYKASEFIGYNVQNLQGEGLGEIEDLMVDVNNSQVRYAVLSFGGFLDIGDKLFAIPLDAIQFNAEEQAFILDVDQERLEQAPGFERENWPDTANPDWDMGYSDFWLDGTTDSVGEAEGTVQDDATVTEDEAVVEGEDGTGAETTTEEQPVVEGQEPMTDQPMAGSVVRASELMDFDIHNAQGEELGEVEDLIIQMGPEHMAYAVLSLEEMDDELAQSGDTAQTEAAEETIENRFYAVPVSNLQFSPEEEDIFVFNADPQMLDTALSFTQDEWTNQMNLEDVN